MSKKKKQGHFPFESKTKFGEFTKICSDMLESPAGIELTAAQIGLYLQIKKKFRPKVVHGKVVSENSQNISFTKAEGLKSFGDGRTFFKNIDRLIDLGFIDCIASGYTTRTCNIYGLSERWKQYGQADYKVPHTVMRPCTVRKKAKMSSATRMEDSTKYKASA